MVTLNKNQNQGGLSRSEIGRKGAEARHAIPKEREREIALKAAKTRESNNPGAFQALGKEGAKARHAKSEEEERAIARKAAETRKANNPNAFVEMGRKGGSSGSRGGQGNVEEEK